MKNMNENLGNILKGAAVVTTAGVISLAAEEAMATEYPPSQGITVVVKDGEKPITQSVLGLEGSRAFVGTSEDRTDVGLKWAGQYGRINLDIQDQKEGPVPTFSYNVADTCSKHDLPLLNVRPPIG